MPMGAVIFADFWLIPKIEIKTDYAEFKNIIFSWPAAVSWGVTLLISVLLPLEIFFKALPGWFIAVALYLVASYIQQKTGFHKLAGEK